MNNLKSVQRGFTLLELLVTIIIGAFITLAAVTFMHNTAMSYHTQDMTARLQENARFAVQMMTYDLRQAGYYGCSGLAPDDTVESVDGFDGGGDESDEVTIRFSKATGGAVDIATDIKEGDDTFEIVDAGTANPATASQFFAAGMQVVISDCLKSEIGLVKKVSEGSVSEVILDSPLQKDYNKTTTIRALNDARYFIQEDDDGVPSLYRAQGGDEQPIVDGVDYMRVLYGVDTNGDYVPDGYRAVSALAAGEKIVSLRLGLLMRSIASKTRDLNGGEFGLESDIGRNNGGYQVLDQAVNLQNLNLDNQRVTRRVFTTTMMLRNQS